MKKSIITVVGKDTVGIIARVCAYLADNNINILDISQTIVQGYFNMMMIVDMNKVSKEFGTISQELDALGENIGVIIKCQREEIFDQMHRILGAVNVRASTEAHKGRGKRLNHDKYICEMEKIA